MDILQKCAENYERLTHFEYKITIARKGKAHTLCVRFETTQFHHLAGIHKLSDLRISRKNREKVFEDIRNGKITDSFLQASRYYGRIADRIKHLCNLERILDQNEWVFRYHKKAGDLSMIDADYLLSTVIDDGEFYIFLSIDGAYCFCRSFFQRTNRDYTKGQMRYTMLRKEKRNRDTGECVVQFNRM